MKTVRRFESSHLRHVWCLHAQTHFASVVKWADTAASNAAAECVRVRISPDAPAFPDSDRSRETIGA